MWRVVQSAKIAQDTSNPCRTAILVGNKAYPLAGSWNDLADKPFGTITEIYDIIPESNGGYDGDGWFYCGKPEQSLVAGEAYAIHLNGTKYECIAYEVDGTVYIGDYNIYNGAEGTTKYPFGFCIHGDSPNFNAWLVMPSVTECIVKVTGPKTTVKQIDPKYLPFTNAEEEVF